MESSKRIYNCIPLAWLAPVCLMGAAAVHFDLPGTDGRRHASADLRSGRAVVLVFLAADCPISNRYSPLLHEMETRYRAQGVPFLAVFSEADAAAEGVRKHLAEFGLEMPGLLDPGASVARQTGARVTPEAVVLAPSGAVLYRGRIDNRYVGWGKTRAEATQHDLRDAIDAVLAGRPVPHPATKALGCAIAGVG